MLLKRNLQTKFLAFLYTTCFAFVDFQQKKKTKGISFKGIFNNPRAPINTKWLLLKFKLQKKMKKEPSNEIFHPIRSRVLVFTTLKLEQH